jgi:hypothetical protein
MTEIVAVATCKPFAASQAAQVPSDGRGRVVHALEKEFAA